MIHWPRGDEYQAAVQHPETAFSDPILCQCFVEETPLGLPKAFAGGFTSTYHLRCPTSEWAVRCFIRGSPTLQSRYRAISSFVDSRKLPYFVEVRYLEQGIRVNGLWHPIVKMEWVRGKSLNSFVGEHVRDATTMLSLAREFRTMTLALQTAGIAHGDLQHGNIMVKGGRLYLIDYDGLYLPGLAHLGASDIGHLSYQHPLRDSSMYDARLDRFSSIVIYSALVALAANPDLWDKYDSAENMLFKQDDFLNPGSSALFQELEALPEIAPLATRIKVLCLLPATDVPTLEDFLEAKIPALAANIPSRAPSGERRQYPVLDARNSRALLERIGQRVEVFGRIDGMHQGISRIRKPYTLLNFGVFPRQTFTLNIWSEGLDAFAKSGRQMRPLVGKWVRVVGVVSSYDGMPNMAVEEPSQIQVFGEGDASEDPLGEVSRQSVASPAEQAPRPRTMESEVVVFNKLYGNRPLGTQPSHSPRVGVPPTRSSARPQVVKPGAQPGSGTYPSSPPAATPTVQPRPSSPAPLSPGAPVEREAGARWAPLLALLFIATLCLLAVLVANSK